MGHSLIITVSLIGILSSLCYTGEAITIDGLFEDWNPVPLGYEDAAGDTINEDLASLKITNDNDFLFLKFSFYDGEHLMQDHNDIRLYIDSDNNDQTGKQVYGIGAELEWCFGCRDGIYHSPSGAINIGQADIVLRSAPTITSEEFEMALSLACDPMTLESSHIPETITIVLAASEASDRIPDQTGGLSYTIETDSVDYPNQIPLKQNHLAHIRVLTYNTLANGLFDITRQDRFYRILRAIKPDIIAYQEQTGDDIVTSLMQDWFQERDFYGVGMGNNNIVVSRYPIIEQALITRSGRTMAVLLETEPNIGANLLVLNSHLACCTNNASRQNDADEITMVMREWHAGRGPFQIPENTPIIHLGDFNLVGDSQQLKTLTEGDIVDEETFGEDFFPDWDGTALTDLFSRHTSIRMGYTWRNDRETFSPGKLDYILYTDDVIELGNHYILNTLAMSESELDKYGLLADDTNLASDHLPRIMDIASVEPVSGVEMVNGPSELKLYQNYPNPFNPTTKINYELPITNYVDISIYNTLGQKVATLVSERQAAGVYQVEWDATGFASGVYYYKLRAGGFVQIRKMALIR
jgi:endonuclease/exonuclease/phosphatase family metal-dependent hydrolase